MSPWYKGIDAFTELSALGRFGGGPGAYKQCDLAGRAAAGYQAVAYTRPLFSST